MKLHKSMKKILYFGIGLFSILGIIFGQYFWNKGIEETTVTAQATLEDKGYEKSKSSDSFRPSDEELGEINGDSISAGDSSDSSSNGDSSNDTEDATQDENGSSDKKDSDDKDSEEGNSDNEARTLDDIKKEYTSAFNELEVEETSKVDQLVVEAKADYVSGKATKSELIAKYSQAATLMELNADKAFQVLYQQLQYDLETNGYDISEADKFQQTYSKKKQARLDRVASEVKGFNK